MDPSWDTLFERLRVDPLAGKCRVIICDPLKLDSGFWTQPEKYGIVLEIDSDLHRQMRLPGNYCEYDNCTSRAYYFGRYLGECDSGLSSQFEKHAEWKGEHIGIIDLTYFHIVASYMREAPSQVPLVRELYERPISGRLTAYESEVLDPIRAVFPWIFFLAPKSKELSVTIYTDAKSHRPPISSALVLDYGYFDH